MWRHGRHRQTVQFDGFYVGAHWADDLVDAVHDDLKKWEVFRQSPRDGKGCGGTRTKRAAAKLKSVLQSAALIEMPFRYTSIEPITDYLAARLPQRELALVDEMARFGIDEDSGTQRLSSSDRFAPLFDVLGRQLNRAQ